MSSSYQKISAFLGVSLSVFFGSCTSTNVEELYQTSDQEARQIYNSELKEVIENKCISCHIFHLEGTNRYDNFEKTKSSIAQMLTRINSTSNIVMPPADSSQLTQEEKALFQQFLNALFTTNSGE